MICPLHQVLPFHYLGRILMMQKDVGKSSQLRTQSCFRKVFDLVSFLSIFRQIALKALNERLGKQEKSTNEQWPSLVDDQPSPSPSVESSKVHGSSGQTTPTDPLSHSSVPTTTSPMPASPQLQIDKPVGDLHTV